MKKIITTLFLVAAAALGAQAQTTNTFPAGPLTTNTFSGLDFVPGTNSLASPPYTRARLILGVTGMITNRFSDIYFSLITLSGQGLSGSVSLSDVSVTANLTDPNDALGGGYSFTPFVTLSPTITSWLSVSNATSFQAELFGNASMPVGSRIYYGLQYADGGNNLNTTFGNTVIVAVPEPSAYVAAAGLLGLCLWSARRHLFKFAGSRSTSSGSGSNGAA